MSETTKPQANSAFGVQRSAKYPCRCSGRFYTKDALSVWTNLGKHL